MGEIKKQKLGWETDIEIFWRKLWRYCMYCRDCECFLGLESLEKSSQKCAAIVWSSSGGFVVPEHMWFQSQQSHLSHFALTRPFSCTQALTSPPPLITCLPKQVLYIEIAKEVYDSCLDNICYRLCTLAPLRDHSVAKHVLSVGNVLGFFVWFVCCHVSIFWYLMALLSHGSSLVYCTMLECMFVVFESILGSCWWGSCFSLLYVVIYIVPLWC
jgi:hypothetical protein